MILSAATLLLAAIAGAGAENLVCAEQTSYALAPGEKLESAAGGIHIGTLEIATPRGVLVIQDGNHWADPGKFDEEVILKSGVRIMGSRDGRGKPRYAVFGRLDGRSWGGDIGTSERLVAWVEGSALRGNSMDDSILERIRTVPFPSDQCTCRLDYGWDVILGE